MGHILPLQNDNTHLWYLGNWWTCNVYHKPKWHLKCAPPTNRGQTAAQWHRCRISDNLILNDKHQQSVCNMHGECIIFHNKSFLKCFRLINRFATEIIFISICHIEVLIPKIYHFSMEARVGGNGINQLQFIWWFQHKGFLWPWAPLGPGMNTLPLCFRLISNVVRYMFWKIWWAQNMWQKFT